MYDLIIIGGGPAAISAGIYGARKKIKILLAIRLLSFFIYHVTHASLYHVTNVTHETDVTFFGR